MAAPATDAAQARKTLIMVENMSEQSHTNINSKILTLLKGNARSTISEIASKVGVSRTTAKEKIDMMLEKGVIRRFTIEIGDSQKNDIPPEMAVFEIKLTRSACKSIYQNINSWPEIVGCYSLAGDLDMILLVQARDTSTVEALREKLVQMHYVQKVQTRTVLKRWDI